MPLERAAERLLRGARAGQTSEEMEFIASVRDAELYHYKRFNRGIFLLRAQTAKSMAKLFYRLLDCMNLVAEETEPRFNAFTYCSEGEFRTIVTLRGASHPQCYFALGDAHFSILPGAADMAGFVVVPREEDFDRLDGAVLEQIFEDVTLPAVQEERLLWRLVRTQPRLEVEIESGEEISFEIVSDGAGPQKVRFQDGRIDYNGVLYDELVFEAVTISTLFAEPSFLIYDEGTRRYAGTLKFLVKDGKVQAVNILGMEDYLLSVISLMPPQEQKERALALRKALLKGEKISDPYIGLTEKADSAARAAIDETWGQIL